MIRLFAALLAALLSATSAFAWSEGLNISYRNGATAVTGTLGVGNGGTGVASWSANNSVVLSGTSGTGAVQLVAGATAGNVLVSGGAGVAPTFTTINLASANAVGASILGVANGGTNLSAAADDNVMVGNGTTWQTKPVNDCDGPTSAITYDTTTNAWGCNTITAGTASLNHLSTLGVITSGNAIFAAGPNVDPTEASVLAQIASAASFTNLACKASAAPGGSDKFNVYLRRTQCAAGGAPPAQTACTSGTDAQAGDLGCTISAAATACTDTTTISPAAGECIAWCINSSATAATAFLNCTYEKT
jgi:hypothetical protein